MDISLEALAAQYAAYTGTNRHQQANQLAMEIANLVLSSSEDRTLLWEKFFSLSYEPFASQYQSQDFEIIDYDMVALHNGGRLFRGPAIPADQLASGNYICIVGAAQLFGRFHRRSFQQLLSDQYNLPVLNLSIGGVGPNELMHPAFIRLMNRARAIVFQVLSGRSVGCWEYPGGWTTNRPGQTAQVPRETILREILLNDRDKARSLMERWGRNYIISYQTLAERITTRKLLLWFSSRSSDQWSIDRGMEGDFAEFPQLVSLEQINIIQKHFDAYAEVPYTISPAQTFTSRFSGQACPYIWPDGSPRWSDSYYPQSLDHEHAEIALRRVLGQWLTDDKVARDSRGDNLV